MAEQPAWDVVICGTMSPGRQVPSRIPQLSILWPVLFSAIINDLDDGTECTHSKSEIPTHGLFAGKQFSLYLDCIITKALNKCCFKALLLQGKNFIFTLLLNQIMATLFEELETQPKQKSQKKKLSEALESILDCVQNPLCPSYVARSLMKILHEVHGEVSPAIIVLHLFCQYFT